jgi:hypothetical protein
MNNACQKRNKRRPAAWSAVVLKSRIFGAFPGDSFKQGAKAQKADSGGWVKGSIG